MFNKKDEKRDAFMLTGGFAKKGYDWWWHSFTAIDEETGKEKPFFIEFFAINPALGADEPILGQLPVHQKAHVKPSYLMVKAGCWGQPALQLNRFFGWEHVRITTGVPFCIDAENCHLDETTTYGSIAITKEEAESHREWMGDSGTLEWNLKIDKEIAFNVGYGAGDFFRGLQAFDMFWHAEGMKTKYSGAVTLNGRKYLVIPDKSYGYADKNWGRDFTSPWVWLSSNDLTSKITGTKLDNSVFDIGGGCPVAFGIAMPRKLLSAFWYEGRPYEFNFSKFWTNVKTDFDCKEEKDQIVWHVRQENQHQVMETDVSCLKKDMLFINYEDPIGQKRHNRLWNGGNGTGTVKIYEKKGHGLELIDDIQARHIGCEYGEYDP